MLGSMTAGVPETNQQRHGNLKAEAERWCLTVARGAGLEGESRPNSLEVRKVTAGFPQH